MKYFKITTYILLFFLIIEIIFRIMGYEVNTPNEKKWPELNMRIDTLLGFSHPVGIQQYKLFNKDIIETNFENRKRITSKDEIKNPRTRINLYGCSVVHGFGITDTLTYPFKLQKLRKHEEINNFAICGHGLLQFYKLLKEHTYNSLKPNIAIIHYGSFHNNRNIFYKMSEIEKERYYRDKNKLYNIPFVYMKFNNNNTLVSYKKKHEKYKDNLMFKYSAFINTLHKIYINILDNPSKKNEIDLNVRLMQIIINHCKKNNIELIVFGVYNDKITENMLNLCKEKNIASYNIAKNLDNVKYKLGKNDNHPNELGCEIFANRVNHILN
jgi:hypothetical protein